MSAAPPSSASFSHSAYQSFLNRGNVNAAAINTDGIILYANNAELKLACHSEAEYIGKPLSAFYIHDDVEIIDTLLNHSPVDDLELCIVCKGGLQKSVLLSSNIYTDENNVSLIYYFSRDISVYKKNERLLSYLNKAAEELASARDTSTALQKISELIVPTFANWFTIELLKNNSLDLLILAHENPEAIKWAHQYRKDNPTDLNSDQGAARVIKTGEPLFVPVITYEMIAERIKDPKRMAVLQSVGMQSVITVAIRSKDAIAGVVSFISTIAGKHYDEADLRFAQNFASHIGLALDNARLNEAAAAEIQTRKHVETQLQIAQAQLRSALSSGMVGTWIRDLKKDIVYLDESLAKMFKVEYTNDGYDPAILTGLIRDEDRQETDQKRNKAMASEGIYETEYQMNIQGEKKWFFVRGKTEAGEDGDLQFFTGVMIDVTERKRAEVALKQSEDLFKLIAETVPLKIFVTDGNGNISYYNPQWASYTGNTVEELKQLSLVPFIHPDDVEKNLEKWNQAKKTSDSFSYEHRFRNKDGEYRWHLTRALSLKDEHGNVLQWIGAVTDINDQKLKEEKKDEFISIASHELRTPLTTVKAFFQLAKRGLHEADRSYNFIDKAGKQLDRLEKLITDLLDVSKINAGKMVYNMEPFNFDAALREAVESAQHTADSHTIIVETAADVTLTGDKLRIEQVINNFLTNAIKYSPGADKVIIRSEMQGNNIIVSVQDFGIGIATENLTGLFERFYRVDNTAMRFQGLGLGLFIASEIIKRHNGSFWIESEVDKGSTFYFLLPVNGKQEFVDIDTDNQTWYKGNFIEIKYDPQMQWLEANWLGYQNLESVQKGCMIMLDLLEKNNCSKVLNDNTYVLGNWSEAVDWGSEIWFPAMHKAGLKYFAWIYSPSTFSRISAQKSIDVALGKITARFFTEKDEAASWLADK